MFLTLAKGFGQNWKDRYYQEPLRKSVPRSMFQVDQPLFEPT